MFSIGLSRLTSIITILLSTITYPSYLTLLSDTLHSHLSNILLVESFLLSCFHVSSAASMFYQLFPCFISCFHVLSAVSMFHQLLPCFISCFVRYFISCFHVSSTVYVSSAVSMFHQLFPCFISCFHVSSAVSMFYQLFP